MPIESANFISELSASNPLGSDPKSTTDDHLRLIKDVLKKQFPNLTPAAINATVAEFNNLVGATANATANKLVLRDANGRAKVAAPSAVDDIARKDTVDAHAGDTAPHNATSAATANRLMIRDANGRVKVAAPSAADDVARKDTVDVHAGDTSPHSATVAGAANRLVLRDASGRAQVAAPSAADDIARKADVDLKVNKAGDTVTGLMTFTRSNGALKIESTIPQIDFSETDNSIRYWFHVNGGNFYLLQDRNGDDIWELPYPFFCKPSGNIEFGFTPLVGTNSIYHQGNDGAGSGLDADRLDGFDSSQGNVVNTVAVRNSDGDVISRLFRSEYSVLDGQGNYFMAQNAVGNGADNYLRPIHVANVRAILGGAGKGLNADMVDGVHLSGLAQLYTGSNAEELNYPIGHTVLVITDTTYLLNQSIPVRRRDIGSPTYYYHNSIGTLLSGTWRLRGNGSGLNDFLAQRVA